MFIIVATKRYDYTGHQEEVVVSMHSTRRKAENAIKAKAREMLDAGIVPTIATDFRSLNDCNAYLGDECGLLYRMFEFSAPDKAGTQLDPLREYDNLYVA